MAIAFDTSATANVTGTSLTFSHTCSGDDRILFLWARVADDIRSVSSATYNGVAMTSLGDAIGDTNDHGYFFYLLNPASGANDVVITADASIEINGRSASYNGVSQTGFPDSQTNLGVAVRTTTSVTATSVADNCWHICGWRNVSSAFTMTAGTFRHTADSMGVADSNAAISPAGANTISGTHDSGESYAFTVTIAPSSVSVVADTPNLLLMGVG